MNKRICTFIIVLFLINTSYIVLGDLKTTGNGDIPSVTINIEPFSVVYEGDIINCTITGDPTVKYWLINNLTKHYTFNKNCPIIFNPEPTPLNDEFVNLSVYVENINGNDSCSVQVKLKKLFFGDIHWHTDIGDGFNRVDEMYKNAISDNYLDFSACSEHADTFLFYLIKPFRIFKTLFNKLTGKDFWQIMKDKAIKYYNPGNFTTLLAFEWSASNLYPGGWKISPNGHEDVSHINFYYRDVYKDAKNYNPFEKKNYDEILTAMEEEWDKGHLNIGFPHHPIAKCYFFGTKGFAKYFPFYYTANWSFLTKKLTNPAARDKLLRGVEVYSRWGTSIGQYSNIPITWPYLIDNLKNNVTFDNNSDAWVENGMWEYSENLQGKKYAMIASSDTHGINRPGSVDIADKQKPAGIIAAYSIHNTREEIWDAMNDCDIYGTQALKIRANVKSNGKIAYGRWINCTSPLKINISAMSTFSGYDSSGKIMCPHGYNSENLNYPIEDIWLIKKDKVKGRPWCKVISHWQPNQNVVVVDYEDYNVEPNDFYYVVIRQKGQELFTGKDDYTAFIGPIFVNNVI